MFFQGATNTLTAAAFAMEKEVSSIFYPDSTVTHNASSSVLVWMTILPLGFYSVVSICSNVVACYQFIAAWNLISRTHQVDLEILHFHKKHILTRRIEIERALDTKLYSEVLLLVDERPQRESSCCPICLNDFEASDRVSSCCQKVDMNARDSNNCNHLFHKDCLQAWLQKQRSCPCCRYDILPLSATQAPPHPILRYR